MKSRDKQAGSPTGEPVYLVIGRLQRPHGVRGEMLMRLHTDFPERIIPGRKVFIGEIKEQAIFETIRPHLAGKLVKFDGYESPESIGRFRNQWVYVRADELPSLPKGRHYTFELLGLLVEDELGNKLGVLTEILETGANDVYVVKDETGVDILLPAIPAVVRSMDMKSKVMRVRIPEGLIPGRDSN